MKNKPLAVAILAAGKGTRMNSELPKVLHEVNIGHDIDIIPTFMGAHAIPVEYKNNPEKFLEEHNIPVINVRNINNLCDWYDLPYERGDYTKESIKIGSGQLYGEKKQYNTVIVWVNLMLSSIIIFWVVLSSVAQVNKKMKEINNE